MDVTNKKRKASRKVSNKKKLKRSNDKLLTTEELNSLKEAESQFHSSLFHMQINELLKEVKIKQKWKDEIELWIESLNTLLFALPESNMYKIMDRSWIKDLKVPIIEKSANRKGSFKFLPPSDIKVVGSYPLGLACLPNATIDLAIEIPKEFWDKSDFLNHRYHRKRALYLVYIAMTLKETDLIENLYFSYHCGNHMKPVLLLLPKGNFGKKLKVCLLPHPPKDYFKLIRFIPSTNNVRDSWFFQDNEMQEQNSTPHYNSSILMDILMVQITEFLCTKLQEKSNLREGLIMLKLWLHQRNLNQGYGGFSNCIMLMFVIYLLEIKKITTSLSSYQVFRNVLLSLSQGNLFEKGIAFGDSVNLEVFLEAYEVVFLDFSGKLNLCSWTNKEILNRVYHEAKLSLESLDSQLSDNFDYLFIKPVDFYQKFDHILHINKCNLNQIVDDHKLKHVVLSLGGNKFEAVLSFLKRLIKQALKNRIMIMDQILWNPGQWEINDPPPDPNDTERFTFGFLLNPDSLQVVDKGPSADHPEAKEFRNFWGEKSELRRFQDGTICEAVVWPGKCFSDKQSIIYHILRHILNRHANIKDTMMEYICNQLNFALHLSTISLPSDWSSSYGIGEEINLDILLKFNTLSKELRKLKELPLHVTSVQGLSPALRYCEAFPPIPTNYYVDKNIVDSLGNNMMLKENGNYAPQWVQPLEVLLNLESSGKWPKDVKAIKHVKAAFYLKLAKLLHSQFSLTTMPSAEYVDVLKDGYIFRLMIACQKEISLLKERIISKGISKLRDTEESIKLEMKTVHLPMISNYIYGLQQQYNAYSAACRLAKRWISSQLLADYLLSPCIELIMAYIFLSPYPFSTPNCPQSAFFRFLFLLYTHDWKTLPLIVNFNHELTKEECSEIHLNFTARRSCLPPMVIVTPYDRDGTMWTKSTPNKVILHNLLTLTKQAYNTLHSQFDKIKASDYKEVFRPPINIYDIIIHLNPFQIPKYYQAVDIIRKFRQPFYEEYNYSNSEKLPVIGYDPPSCYLKELKECFDEIAYFFYDHCGGDAIYVIWKPKAFTLQDFKVSSLSYKKVDEFFAEGKTKMITNLEAVIDDFVALGAGLVKSVNTKTDQLNIL